MVDMDNPTYCTYSTTLQANTSYIFLIQYRQVDFTLHIEEIGFIRQLFIKRMSKEYYTPSTSKFADEEEAKKGSTEEPQNKNEKKQEYNMFQRFKLYYFGRSKSHQDDIKVVDEKVNYNHIYVLLKIFWRDSNKF